MRRCMIVFFLVSAFLWLLAGDVRAEAFDVVFQLGDRMERRRIDSKEDLKDFVRKQFPGYALVKSADVEPGKTYILQKLERWDLKDGNAMRSIEAPSGTAREILAYAGIELGSEDIVIPDGAFVPAERRISVLRVETKTVTVEESLPFETVEELTTELPMGKEMTAREGVDGRKKVTRVERFINGKLFSSMVLSEEVTTNAIARVVRKGTDALTAVTRGGGVRQLTMVATCYEAGPRSTGKRPGDRGYGITRSGTRVRRGVVAVDPRVIPLGTRLYIKSLDPSIPDYGFATAEDTGGAIKGMKIDLFMETMAECFQFGKRKVRVYILPPDTDPSLFP